MSEERAYWYERHGYRLKASAQRHRPPWLVPPGPLPRLVVVGRGTGLEEEWKGLTVPAADERFQHARSVGSWAARLGFVVITGGGPGTMRAVSQGAAEAGGLVVGILPGETAEGHGQFYGANAFVHLPLPTGLGWKRNFLMAHLGDAMVVLPGGLGTLQEVAVALESGLPVCVWEEPGDPFYALVAHRFGGAITHAQEAAEVQTFLLRQAEGLDLVERRASDGS